jgi:hypothetical protein
METEPKPSLRDELLARAKLGEITPEEAETEALFAECGPLEVRSYPIDIDSKTSLTDLDPGTEPAWTLLMALVWIIARDPIAVRAVWKRRRGSLALTEPPPFSTSPFAFLRRRQQP